ncbi:phosphatidate cytidylyltransferase [Falsihalocynthiibacter sp. S25ZX9]|uniref:phosphatidate cytidylyltransferase n=1 Tax=Falsihalocynthiibacter sp. S25ZX9 TaxID=3240870 RepID=UPI00350FC1B9
MSRLSKWSDLMPRTMSAIVMAVVGVTAVYSGGILFNTLIILSLTAMLWELWRMMAETLKAGRDWPIFAAYALVIVSASWAFIFLRGTPNGIWTITGLFVIVVLTDIFGYFAGKIFGGPKFWPLISPKKTWSGTVAGWVLAGIFGAIAALYPYVPESVLLVSPSVTATALSFMLLSFASQMGDIAESALKRRYKIKDSSNLIPGHGGFLDRFDGMVGVGCVSAVYILIVLGFGV